MGRTDWDRNYIEMLNPSATYFHCEELLRRAFYENTWQKQNKNPSDKTFVLTSTINPNMYKGLDLIYRTLPLLEGKSIQWNILGIKEDSSLNKAIQRILKIKKTPAELIFHGSVGETELIDVLKQSDVFVHPSYIDNSPNSVCEAMLLSMPVIASSVGGVPSLITHKESGILFNPYDRFDLAGWIHHLMRFPEKGIEYGQTAREIAQERHNPDKILKNLLEIYSSVIQKS
jgi:glycosyltransferase involved in cell wall biosynthesis